MPTEARSVVFIEDICGWDEKNPTWNMCLKTVELKVGVKGGR